MTKHPTIKKLITFTLLCVALVGIISYEVYSITRKEYDRQTEIANSTHEKINYNLDMIKIGVQTGDRKIYVQNLLNAYNNSNIIKPLSFIKDQESNYLTSLSKYILLLKNETKLLQEISELKTEISNIKTQFQEQYSDKSSITRDKLTGLSAEVKKLKINSKKYSEKASLKIVNTINSLLDGIIAKANALSECIDECYVDRINEINDELADTIKSFANQTESLNQSLEDQFDFTKMDELKKL